MAVVSEVSKGDVPPQNPYRVGAALHYYWLAHLIPSIEHRLTMDATSLRQLLLANAVLAGLVFVGFFYLFVRHFVESPTAAAIACVAAVLFHSFEGTEQLYALWQLGAPLDLVRYLNIDAVTRWIYHSMPVDGLQRLLLYQPQHQLGHVMGLSALLLLVQVRDAARASVMALAGLFIAMSLLLSTFSALMIATVAALFQGVRLILDRRWSRIPLLRAGGDRADRRRGAARAVSALRGIRRAAGVVQGERNGLASGSVRDCPQISAQCSRAQSPAACSHGGARRWRNSRCRPRSAGGSAGSSTSSWTSAIRQHVYVGWRAGHLLFIAFTPPRGLRVSGALARGQRDLVADGASAPPSCWLAPRRHVGDRPVYNLRRTPPTVRERRPFTGRLRHPARRTGAAFAWVKQHTPLNATVQVDPEVRDAETWPTSRRSPSAGWARACRSR